MNTYFMVFDVESVGLHGEAYAVGWVVVNNAGYEIACGKVNASLEGARGTAEGMSWAEKNAKPELPLASSTREVRRLFWEAWTYWKAQGAVLAADCPWPVEARFLIQCVEDNFPASEWQGPYPFIDVASVLFARGLDPLATETRLENELPIHDPLADARQSARLLMKALRA
jgi:hypothetical protein